MNPRSRMSGLSASLVAHERTRNTSSCPFAGLAMKSFTVAVNKANWTSYVSSAREKIKSSRRVSAFSILAAYCPMTQIIDFLDSGSSRLSRFSHNVEMMDSYCPGYFRRISRLTTVAS